MALIVRGAGRRRQRVLAECLTQIDGRATPTIETSRASRKIGADLNLSTGQLQWIVSAYVLGYGGFLLLGGRAADLLGRRQMFLISLAVFMLASGLGAFVDGGRLRALPADRRGLGLPDGDPAHDAAGGRRLRPRLRTAQHRGDGRHRPRGAGPRGRPGQHLVPVRGNPGARGRGGGQQRVHRRVGQRRGPAGRLPAGHPRLGHRRPDRPDRDGPPDAGRPVPAVERA